MENLASTHFSALFRLKAIFIKTIDEKGHNDRHGLASPLAMSMGQATLGLFEGARLVKANLGRRRGENVTRLRLTFFSLEFCS